ncbi:hypothetical protein AMAG_09010 [Allomyces macrogynus ATCC 38327]|uniref:Cilia- and flagella-associated protein 263 n=1 Tax=Allomyces macrogynus (strain ATCC 38327) TaxID=578462 RepID=A0A0L0SN66_ALLM3|nr:hypothetical protein AMAG_09010 [Allomyces macrogynus ATCC 38327]|eukprot:KNE63947.1 hypothetical protein AMAG_09010 [Allomyces macrogynus ATCC 38327]
MDDTTAPQPPATGSIWSRTSDVGGGGPTAAPRSAGLDRVDFDAYTSEQLLALADELERKNDTLALENRLFEQFYQRSTSTGPGPAAVSAGPARPPAWNGAAENVDDSRSSGGGAVPGDDPTAAAAALATTLRPKKKKGDKVKQMTDVVVLLTPEQKAEIATRELEELRDDMEKRKLDWGKAMDNLRAEMEEIEIGVSEIKKAMYEFKRDIVQTALSERTGKVMAEKVIRYFEDKMRARDTTLEKIRLKNSTLKTQKNKLMLQLKQKEEMGEVLHAIDFDQLKIENHQYLAKIEERNAELLKLKMAAGKIMQVMNVYKRRLAGLEDESGRLRFEIKSRRDLLARLHDEAQQVHGDTDKALRVNKTLMAAGREFRVPSVMEYVMLKANHEELLTKVRSWRCKVEIAQMALTRNQQLLGAMVAESARTSPTLEGPRKRQLESRADREQMVQGALPAPVSVAVPAGATRGASHLEPLH